MSHPASFINGKWRYGSADIHERINPATGRAVWAARHASQIDADDAVRAARNAFESWAATAFEVRAQTAIRFATLAKERRVQLAQAITQDTAKPMWEALTEADAIAGKIGLTLQAIAERASTRAAPNGAGRAVVRYRPHGVIVVLGPFNLPGHLPNGHIVPALLMGNAVVFKASELTPLTAHLMTELWHEAGLPPGVLNLLQAGPRVGQYLSTHSEIDGLCFTGSSRVGCLLAQAFAQTPGRMLALEMGGNNPLVVWNTDNVTPAVYDILQSAYITSGQRCTCARRLIIPTGTLGDDLIRTLVPVIDRLVVGGPEHTPEPFMGPVITPEAGNAILETQRAMTTLGARPLVECRQLHGNPAMLTPGLLDVTGISNIPDIEIFGPLLQLIRVDTFDDAIREANRTRYGLAAGLLSDDADLFTAFANRVRAGVVNFNRPTTGASGALPFGGVGLSGNHRPSGFHAVDYCAYPVASLECGSLSLPQALSPGVSL